MSGFNAYLSSFPSALRMIGPRLARDVRHGFHDTGVDEAVGGRSWTPDSSRSDSRQMSRSSMRLTGLQLLLFLYKRRSAHALMACALHRHEHS